MWREVLVWAVGLLVVGFVAWLRFWVPTATRRLAEEDRRRQSGDQPEPPTSG